MFEVNFRLNLRLSHRPGLWVNRSLDSFRLVAPWKLSFKNGLW